ncbi:MAG: type III secretion protein [Puniceicoccales bacterium]|nr:type III secretion protein [Puniceicoccales bacterium]
MKYVLADLVRVRTLRKDRLERELLKAKERLAEAERQVPIREKELADYEKWLDEEIDRQYAKLIGKQVRQDVVTDFAATIRTLRGRVPEYVKRVQDAKADVCRAEEELQKKYAEVEQANRDLEKLLAHRSEWEAEQAKLEEMSGDKELEESVRLQAQGESVAGDGGTEGE